MDKRLHLVVSGRVQGVFYRDFIQTQARSLGLTGWVRNTEDDHVEVVAEGDLEHLKQLLSFAKQGPGASKVDNVKAKWSMAKKEFSTFEVEK
ncbi:MAG TPA: acylphosphatase [Candidatus Nanoarchaeia archaeon]|nr:acylphosphatase [Candidatus Nanoarchaeia archaeon]